MKFNKKGFTLVELLAVIVILAVIAVIAVPSILGIIENARKDAFSADVRSAFKSVELEYTRLAATGSTKTNFSYTELNLENQPFTAGEFLVTTNATTGDVVISISQQFLGTKYKTSATTGQTMGTFEAGVTK